MPRPRPATVTDNTGNVWQKMSTGYYRRAGDKAGKEVSYETIRDQYGIRR